MEQSTQGDNHQSSNTSMLDDEIKKTCKILKQKNKKFTLMHCVSIYPTPLEEVHLNRIDFLRDLNENVGLSEHSNYEKDQLKTSIASLLFDVKYIERHFTLDRTWKGTDHAASLEPSGLDKLCRDIKNVHSSLKYKTGNGIIATEKFQRKKLKDIKI